VRARDADLVDLLLGNRDVAVEDDEAGLLGGVDGPGLAAVVTELHRPAFTLAPLCASTRGGAGPVAHVLRTNWRWSSLAVG